MFSAFLILTILPIPAVSTVSAEGAGVGRGDFLRYAISEMRIPLEEGGNFPFERVSPSHLPYARTAHAHGALKFFEPTGSTVNLLRNITRIEALQVLAAFKKLTPKSENIPAFTDVTTKEHRRAVAVALEQKWMRPVRSALFGAKLELKEGDMRLLLSKVTQKKGVTILSPKPQVIRIDLNGSSPRNQNLPKQDILETVWELLSQQSLYRDRLQAEDAAYRAIEGIVESIDDPYTTFMRPVQSKQFQTQMEGEISGIGAQVDQKDGVLIIVTPLNDSPAYKSGLKAGDEILSADGVSLTGLGYEEAVDKVRGPKGSSVKLRIRRNGVEFDVSVVRDVIRISELEVAYQDGVAVVRLQQFGQVAQDTFRAKMKEVAESQPKGVILDLRNNPGGLLYAAGVVASAFLPHKSVYSVIEINGNDVSERTDQPEIFEKSMPVAVLLNRGSASAAEIVAGALQEAGRATLVGETTFGKGTVQEVIQFNDGSSLKMTIAEWKTPKGKKIDGIGINPDIAVSSSDGRDDVLLRALTLFR